VADQEIMGRSRRPLRTAKTRVIAVMSKVTSMEEKSVTCPKCAKRSSRAIIDLCTEELYCASCYAHLPMVRLSDPRRPARTDSPSTSKLAAKVQSSQLRAILLAFGEKGQVLRGDELHGIWGDTSDVPTDESIERQVRRYNETLRRLGSGFVLRYSRRATALILVPSDR
jgi:hypothetical protein